MATPAFLEGVGPTKPLYWEDTELCAGTSKVVAVDSQDPDAPAEGPAPPGPFLIVLDETVFHPQGGGQPADRGVITCGEAAMEVVMVKKTMEGHILHYGTITAGGASDFSVGAEVECRADPGVRKEHARLHSAGHLIDVVVRAELGPEMIPNKGYHFPDNPYVEYKGKLDAAVDKEALAKKLTEDVAALVGNDVATISHNFLTKAQADRISDPNAPEGEGGEEEGPKTYRVVVVGGLSCLCAGTHVKSTSAMAGLTITKVHTKKGVTRVSYCYPEPPP